MNKKNTATYIIVGAGLSGLTSAYHFSRQNETNYLVLESRDRIGGRILTKNGIDFGATWFQNHHKNVFDLIDDLGLKKSHQYSKGKSVLVYNSMAPAHFFESDPNAPTAYRVAGGSNSIINNLADGIKEKIRTNTTLTELIETKDGVTLVTNNGTYYANKVLLTIPPQIATRISYSPTLSEATLTAMKNTHTWMSNAIKVGLTFKTCFWRKNNMSGTLIGQVGAVTELYDHCSSNGKTFSLMGFVNETLREFSAAERKEKILTHIKKYLGDEILDYASYTEKDWSIDKDTSSEQIKSIYMSPQYGNTIFSDFHLNGKLLFSGTETSPIYGGYMDGAIYSGINAANMLLES